MLRFDTTTIEATQRALRDLPGLQVRAVAFDQYAKLVIESERAGDLETVARLSLVLAPDGSSAMVGVDPRVTRAPRDLPFALQVARRLAQEGRRFRISLSSHSPIRG